MENRSRRINLNFFNFEEGLQREENSCAQFISKFVVDHMKVRGIRDNVAIHRAHRVPTQPLRSGRSRPIKVAFVDASIPRCKLFAAPKCLRDNPYHGKDIYVTDGVSKSVLNDRNRFATFQSEFQKKKCYIAWRVPATCMVEEDNGSMHAMTVKDLT